MLGHAHRGKLVIHAQPSLTLFLSRRTIAPGLPPSASSSPCITSVHEGAGKIFQHQFTRTVSVDSADSCAEACSIPQHIGPTGVMSLTEYRLDILAIRYNPSTIPVALRLPSARHVSMNGSLIRRFLYQ